MAILRLSDQAFGNLGLTITETLDLAGISQQLSGLLDTSYQFDSLDLSGVTRTGLSVQGLGLEGSRLTAGDFSLFDPQGITTGFETLGISMQTIAAQGPEYALQADAILALSTEERLAFNSELTTIDFSGTGTEAVTVSIEEVAQFDMAGSDFPYQGYQVIGNAGDNTFFGNVNLNQQQYAGSNAFFAGEGNDVLLGGLGGELLEGGAGDDRLFGDDGDDLLLGHVQGDPSGAGNDILYGGLGFDELIAGAGNDALFAGEGVDTLTGGAGADRFYVAENYAIDSGETYFEPDFGDFLPLYIYTGDAIASNVDEANVIADFSAAEDLLVFSIRDFDASAEEFDYSIEFSPAQDGGTDIYFQSNFFDTNEFYLHDSLGEVTTGNLLIQVQQGFGDSMPQNLGAEVLALPGETSTPLSFEVRYQDAGESNVESGVDRFQDLQVNLAGGEAVDGSRGGQDKFDLTALDLDVTPEAIEDILFTQGEDYGSFTVEQYDPQEGTEDIADFFYDTDADAYRAVHVEAIDYYESGSNTAIAVYVDADSDGAYSFTDDLSFIVESLSDGSGATYDDFSNPLAKTDLYDDSGDGSGTGLFVFNDAQYNLWFNDVS